MQKIYKYYQILILNFDNIINLLFSIKNIDIYEFIRNFFFLYKF